MSDEMIPYRPTRNLELYRDTFLVPQDWTSCGPAIYLSGAPGVRDAQPVAVALTPKTLSLCGPQKPIWSLPLGSVKDVRTTNLTGVSFPIDTPAGVTYMTPPAGVGVEVSFNLTNGGMVGRVVWCTMTPQSAHDWVNDITDAAYLNSIGSDVERRQRDRREVGHDHSTGS